MFGILKVIQGWVKIKGNSDGTKIGNTGDRLHTNSTVVNSDNTETMGISSIDPGNTTNALLGIGAIFTGAWTKCDNHSSVTVTAITDQYSAIDGVKIQFSQTQGLSGLTRELSATIIPNTDGIYFAIPCEDKFYRIVYENGATAQTIFRLTSQLKTESGSLSASPLISSITDTTSAPLVRSILAGKSTETNLFENITTTDGRIRVQSISVPEQLSERFREYAEDGGSIELAVNGGGTPVEFFVNANATKDLVVDFLSFQAFDSGIKIDNFLGRNSPITNGVLVEIKSEDKLFQFKPIKNTTEFNSLFAFGSGRSFDLVFASGNDSMVATFGPASPFVIKSQGTYGTDDYIKIVIQDNISAVSRLRFLAGGRVK